MITLERGDHGPTSGMMVVFTWSDWGKLLTCRSSSSPSQHLNRGLHEYRVKYVSTFKREIIRIFHEKGFHHLIYKVEKNIVLYI